ncbi:MAG: hypothetical protein DLM52_11030 [Chthoniobacterales bacterium]|nr:MAG: hypothetical protein DLM52_11030 [Chthoniobacterales bacterium]
MFKPTALIDPYGQRTTFTYDPVNTTQLTQITEPGGRYIQLSYTTIGGLLRIDHITASDGLTVQYSYQTLALPFDTTALTGVTYLGDNTMKATYTYQPANVSPDNNFPLLATCDDPMYAGPKKKIQYSFATANADSTIPVAAGQLDSEKSGTTGVMVSQLVVHRLRSG